MFEIYASTRIEKQRKRIEALGFEAADAKTDRHKRFALCSFAFAVALIFLPFGKWLRLMLVALSICTALGTALVYDRQKRNAKRLWETLEEIERKLPH